MSGVTVVRRLLAAASPVTAVVAAANIKAGVLPLNTTPPAIAITSVSGLPRNTLSMRETNTLINERVQITAVFSTSADGGADYGGMLALLTKIRQALPNQRGTIGSVWVESITPDVQGPDLEDTESGILIQSQDVFVRWREAR